MVDCTNAEVQGALPDLVHGRLGGVDRATMSAHVESCAACRAELGLLQQLRDSAPLAPSMDLTRIAAAIPPYGGAAVITPVGVKRDVKNPWTRSLLAIAAVAAVGIGILSMLSSRDTTGAPEASASASTAPVSSPTAAPPRVASGASAKPAIEARVGSAPTVSGPKVQLASLSLVGGTQDLSEEQLELLLSHLEGMESLPSEEPQSVTHSVENIEDGT